MKKQQGLSLIGMILVSAVVIGIAIVGMKVVPSVIEYYTVIKHIKSITGSGVSTVAEVRTAYDRYASVDDTPSVTGADLEITKEGNQIVIYFEYPKKIHIAGNVSILIEYAGSSSGSKRPIE
jgi:Tfp pilus assembly major pilin PilA